VIEQSVVRHETNTEGKLEVKNEQNLIQIHWHSELEQCFKKPERKPKLPRKNFQIKLELKKVISQELRAEKVIYNFQLFIESLRSD